MSTFAEVLAAVPIPIVVAATLRRAADAVVVVLAALTVLFGRDERRSRRSLAVLRLVRKRFG